MPHLLKQPPFLSTIVFSTIPTSKLGFYLIIDKLISFVERSPFTIFTEDDVLSSFNVTELKYYQKTELNKQVSFIPYPSGNTIGGAIYEMSIGFRRLVVSSSIGVEQLDTVAEIDLAKVAKADIFITQSQSVMSNGLKQYGALEAFKGLLVIS